MAEVIELKLKTIDKSFIDANFDEIRNMHAEGELKAFAIIAITKAGLPVTGHSEVTNIYEMIGALELMKRDLLAII